MPTKRFDLIAWNPNISKHVTTAINIEEDEEDVTGIPYSIQVIMGWQWAANDHPHRDAKGRIIRIGHLIHRRESVVSMLIEYPSAEGGTSAIHD